MSLTLSCIYNYHIWMWSNWSKRKFRKHLHTLPTQRKLMYLGGLDQGLNCSAVSKCLLCSIFLITDVGALKVGTLMYPIQQCQDAVTWFHWSAAVYRDRHKGQCLYWINDIYAICCLTHWALGDAAINIKVQFEHSLYKLVTLVLKLLSREWHRSSLMRR